MGADGGALLAQARIRTAEEGVERTVLANGLTVLSEHFPGVRSIALGAWVRAASLHEPRERMGISHLLEHLVFKGTERRSAREIAGSLESLGGSLDAYTSREHTCFQARVLDEHLPQAADVIADLVFRPLLRADDLTLERKVVLEEIAMVDDTPDDLVFELHNAALWGEHPYGYSILGTRESVAAIPVDAIRDLHDRAYHPRQIVVAAAGNVEHAELLAALERTGWHGVPHGPEARFVAPPAQPAPPVERVVERESQQVHVVFGSATVPHADPRRFTLMLVDTLLGGGMSSRLFQRIREELGLVYSVYAFQSFHAGAGVHGIYLGTAPDTATQAIAAAREELARLAREGIGEAELQLGKQQLKGQITLSMEGVTSRMYRAAAVELFNEPFQPLDEVLARIDAITTDDTRDVCARFFRPEGQTMVRLGPAGA
ncbi:MAG TPA: pitrilysin family protein [Gemmatimonadaceae bacterium]|nr:pitrilysin family protein [Gemmatimonadaceae bacterium]